jgi:hypothetical protein
LAVGLLVGLVVELAVRSLVAVVRDVSFPVRSFPGPLFPDLSFGVTGVLITDLPVVAIEMKLICRCTLVGAAAG